MRHYEYWKEIFKEFTLYAISLVSEQKYSRAEAAGNLESNTNLIIRWMSEHEEDNDGQCNPPEIFK